MIRLLLFLLFLTTPCFATDYYISPTGEDSNDGLSNSAPIATFVQAHTLMSGGDTLYLMDGTYAEQLVIPAEDSGSSGAYTKFIAVNTGAVTIAPTSLRVTGARAGSVWVDSTSTSTTSYVEIDGLFIKGVGENRALSVSSSDAVDIDTMTHHVNIKNCGVFGSGYETDTVPTVVSFARDILVEDFFSFGFGRYAFTFYVTQDVTMRRAVLRFDWWEGSAEGEKPNDPRDGLSIYNTHDATLENILVFDMGNRPVAHQAGDQHGLSIGGNDTGQFIEGSENINIFGTIIFNNSDDGDGVTTNGVNLNGGSGSAGTCASPGATSDVALTDCVVSNNSGYGINVYNNIVLVDLDYITTNENGNSGINVAHYPANVVECVTIDYCYADNNGNRGIYWLDTDDTPANITVTNNTNQSDIEAAYAPIVDYIPTSTPVMGYERGATVDKQYVDGVETTTDLWPWNNEDWIKEKMCDPTLLQELTEEINTYNTANPGDGWTNKNYLPDWCATDKDLTTYVWEYLGNDCPKNVCSASPASGGSLLGGNTHLPFGGNGALIFR